MPRELTDTNFNAEFLRSLVDERNAPNLVVEPPTTESKDDPLDLQGPGPALRDTSGRVTLLNVFRHQDAHPVVLDILMAQKYGPEWLDWEGETIEHRIPLDFRSSVSVINLSKLQAMRTLHMVDSFWQRWEIFCWCCMPLNGIFPDFDTMQVPSVAQCAVAVDMANRVRDDMQWTEEIKNYLAVVHRHDEILVPQSPLDFVKIDTEGFPVNVTDIAMRWASVRSAGKAPTGNTVEDEQLRRMLMIHEVLEDSRLQLRTQLREVLHA